MEIIHLILGKANPERMNGVNRVVHEMATVQTNYGYNVQVWGITANTVHDYPVRVFTTRLFQSYKNPFKTDRKLKQALLEKAGSIVVHIHGAFLPRFYSISGFLRQHNIPFILTPHSSYNLVMMKKNALIKKIYFSLFEKKLLDRCSKIHLLGKTEWDGLEKIYNNQKSMMIPYGFTRIADKEDDNARFKTFTVAYCGRISILSKGLDIMLQGYAKFHREFPGTQLMILGDGKEKSKLMELAVQLGIENSVEFRGSVFGEEKVKLLKQSHVFAHPSRTDGIPATIVESASIGLPCVVSEATNTGDYITAFDAGYTMQQLDAEHFYLGLKDIYNRITVKNESKLLTENAYRMIDVVFNWKTILKKFDTVYQAALQEKNIQLAVTSRIATSGKISNAVAGQ